MQAWKSVTVIVANSTNQLSLCLHVLYVKYFCVFVYICTLLAVLFWGNVVMASSRI